MRLLWAILLLGVCASATYLQPETAEKPFLLKQKKIYNLLYHVSQPEIQGEVYQIGRDYNIEANFDKYDQEAGVKHVLELKARGFLPRGSIYSAYYYPLLRESYHLFKLFYFAKDFDTFYKTACWARIHVNEGSFCCALYNAVLRREDTKFIQLPPPYELYPYAFFNNEVIEKAHHAKVFGKQEMKKTSGMETYIIPANYSGWYLHRDYDYETKLNYWTEDIGLNSYYFFLRQDKPFWLKSTDYGFYHDRGEEYLYAHQQLMNRYYLERLSNDLAKVEDFDWNEKFYPGYYPSMTYHNGLPVPQRPPWTKFPYYKTKYITDIKEYETRISAAIDSGFALDVTGKMVNIYTPEGLNILGNMIEGNVDSCNPEFYGSIEKFARKILGFGLEPIHKHEISPSSLEMFTMSLRDPAFYRMYKRIINYYYKYKMHMEPYTKEKVVYENLKITEFDVDKLTTYFDQYDASISNGLMVDNQDEAENLLIKVRQYRLNHKPFSFRIGVHSDREQNAAIRIFIGPKYDSFKKPIDFYRARKYFYEMDNFIVKMKSGWNNIVRNSNECFFTMPDPEPTEVFYKRVLKALESGETFTYMPRVHGFPERLLLPRGKKEGFPLQIFVHVAPAEEVVEYSSRVFGSYKLDNRSYGYPLDRPVKDFHYNAGNMVLKDIMIYHRDETDTTFSA